MLRYKEVFRPTRLKDQKAARIRVLGPTHDDKLLILVNTTTQTAIEAVSADGSSVTVMSFQKYVDLVNAHLSADHELCHIVERVPSNKGFTFISTIYHIFGNAKSKEIKFNEPIVGFFMPEVNNGVYQMVHVIGKRLSQVKVILHKRSIDIEKLRGGVHIPNLVGYKFNHKESILTAIYSSEKAMCLSVFDLDHSPVESTKPQPINILKTSLLPDELALNPRAQLHLPYFRNAHNRLYITRRNNKYCVIQQIFNGPDTFLSFCISMYPQTFNQFITAPNVPSDLPLCFAQFDSIVVAFVPNEFMCIIDVYCSPPSITVLPKQLAVSVCGAASASLPLPHTIINVDTGEIFDIKLDFNQLAMFIPLLDRSSWFAFSHIAARTLDKDHLVALFTLLEKSGDLGNLYQFIRDLLGSFSVAGQRSTCGYRPAKSRSSYELGRSLSVPTRTVSVPSQRRSRLSRVPAEIREALENIEEAFPSAGPISRKRAFKDAVKAILERKTSRNYDQASAKALELLKRQNAAAVFIAESIKEWVSNDEEKISISSENISISSETISTLSEKKSDDIAHHKILPSPDWVLAVELTLESECAFASFPQVPLLRHRVSEIGGEMLSRPLMKQLESVGIASPSKETTEAEFWLDRLGIDEDSSSDSSTTSSHIYGKRAGSDHSGIGSGGDIERGDSLYDVL